MNYLSKSLAVFTLAVFFGCANDDQADIRPELINTSVNFQFKSSVKIGGAGASEISAFDPRSNKLFTVNTEANEIAVLNITDLNNPVLETPISVNSFGNPNSVAAYEGILAVAVEASIKQNPGKIAVYNTEDNKLIREFTVGALPDMLTFSKDGNFILSANEGEPNSDYTVDPEGTISIIDLQTNTVTNLDFNSFSGQQATLIANGFRVFGPNASFAQDIEPEYITISEDSKTAWVSLQENNGIAKINLESKTIEEIFPLGYKNYNLIENSIDASDKDGAKELKNWPVFGMYQPDGITSVSIDGIEYIITANEGDARDYDAFAEEERIKDVKLNSTNFPSAMNYQDDANMGRLKITSTLGDNDGNGTYEELYSFGTRSFSIWSSNAGLIYDSGNSIAQQTLSLTPNRFNDDDARSDDKGAEPESVEVLNIANLRYILFVGLERNDQVLMYDITTPSAPEFLSILSNPNDEAPEGLLVIPAKESPSGKDILVVSNEDSGTVTFYENVQ